MGMKTGSDMENKFKIGDRVRIKSRQWYLNNRDYYGYVKLPNSGDFELTPSKARYCGYIFEIARMFKSNKGYMVYALNFVDGYFTEDMFDMAPEDAPLTITKDNYFGAVNAIERNANWYKSFPLPTKTGNVGQKPYDWYNAIDSIAEDVILTYYKGKFSDADPIGLLRPYTLDDSCLDGDGYCGIPDFGVFCHNTGRYMAAIYVVVWRFKDGKEYYGIVSIHNPESSIYHEQRFIHEHNDGKVSPSYEAMMKEACKYVRTWFHSDKYKKGGDMILKWGQKVRVKPQQWYDLIKDEYGLITMSDTKGEFSSFMSEYCSQVLTLREQISRDLYRVQENGFVWPRWAFDLVSEDEIGEKQINAQKDNNVGKISNIPKTYLMHDSNTGYTKIGMSVNPRQRERTLQSEKPTITLFRVCDTLVEKKLHSIYAAKRVRGEWFDLTESDIEKICNDYQFHEV